VAIDVTTESFERDVVERSRDVPVVVDFWAAWCGPCRMIAPTVDQLALEYAGKLKVVKMDVDQNPDVSGRLGVLSIPTLMVFKGGQMVERILGAVPKQALLAKLTPHL
jgi:thioredoxin 1